MKKRDRQHWLRFLLFGIALWVGAGAQAGVVTQVQIRDADGGMGADGASFGFYLEGTASYINGTDDGGAFINLGVGTFSLDADWGSGFQSLLTYCLEPTQNVMFGLYANDPVGLTYEAADITDVGYTEDQKQILETLWANAFDDSLTSDVKAAAFQAVLWEISIDDEYFFTDGNFALNFNEPYTLDVILQAREWLDNILNGVWTTKVDLVALHNETSQDFLVPVSTIPGPGALAVMGVAGLIKRRRRS
ncbi:MAG TPA: hypothetical protein VG711_10215 [Phycisphaerales bacterium]|nr:hypothetical protein [Phycisphaerales bacterium]